MGWRSPSDDRQEVRRQEGIELLAWLPHHQQDPEFLSPERQRTYAAQLRAQGIRGVLWMYEASEEAAAMALHAQLDLHVNPLVPNMRAYLRDASDYGVIGAALQRFRRLRLADKGRIALHNARRASRILVRDFVSGVLIMAEMELVKFRPYAPSWAFLNASVTDLALALDNARLVRDFVRLAERTYGMQAGLATHNYGILAGRLKAWGIRPGGIAAPFNPRGYLMNPSKEECERTLKGLEIEVFATHVEVDGLVGLEETFEYLHGLGIRHGIVELGV